MPWCRFSVSPGLGKTRRLKDHLAPFAAGGVEGVLGPDGVRVEFLVREEGELAGLLGRPAPAQGSVLAEDLERRAEGGQVKVHATDARLLELGNPLADGGGHPGLDLFTVDGLRILGWYFAGAADEEARALGGGLLLDVQFAPMIRTRRRRAVAPAGDS